jgi:Family of unknown function (DUF6444)
MMPPPDLSTLSEAEKDCLILNLWPLAERVQDLMRLVAVLQARIAAEAQVGEPPKNSDNSSQPPSSDRKADRPAKGERTRPRAGSVGRTGGGRSLCAEPDQTFVARASTAFGQKYFFRGAARHSKASGRNMRSPLPMI